MPRKTVVVGDTEVAIEETAGGFEVTEVENGEPAGPFIQNETEVHSYSVKLPLDADYVVENDPDGYMVYYDPEDNLCAGRHRGSGGDRAAELGYDGHVYVKNLEIVDE